MASLDSKLIYDIPVPLTLTVILRPATTCKGQALVAPGTYLHYHLYGPRDATTKVILIMGLHGSKVHWNDLVAALMTSFPSPENLQLLTFDNRGIGQSTFTPDAVGAKARASRFTTSMMADDALGLLTQVGWETAHVMGVR